MFPKCPACRSPRHHFLTIVARKSFLSRARKQAVKYANFRNLVLAHSAVALAPDNAGVRVLDSNDRMYAFGASGSKPDQLPAPWPKRLQTIWKRFW
jgi:hypothetical protein